VLGMSGSWYIKLNILHSSQTHPITTPTWLKSHLTRTPLLICCGKYAALKSKNSNWLATIRIICWEWSNNWLATIRIICWEWSNNWLAQSR
jgi:hypothetical protein